MSLTSRLQALLTYANNKTGHSDTTLGDAVRTLADGYGQGGSAVASGEITLDSASDRITINHNLGAENVVVIVENKNPTYGTNETLGAVLVYKTGIVLHTATELFRGGVVYATFETRTTYSGYALVQANNTQNHSIYSKTSNSVTLPTRTGSYKWQAGTYKYTAIKLS